LRDNGQLAEAVVAYRQAVALNPNLATAYSNLGNALREMGQLDEAIAAYRQAIVLKPNYPQAWNNLGNALRDKGQLVDAISAARQAIALKPDYADAQVNLGTALGDNGQLEDAIAAYRQAIVLKPDLAEAYNNLGNALKDKAQLEEAIAAFRQAIVLRPSYCDAHSNLIVAMHYQPGCDAGTIAEENNCWSRQYAEPLRRFIQPHANNRKPDRRLRIGYISPDLRDHPVGRFLLPLVAQHDTREFEVFAYAQLLVPDARTEQLRSHVEGWRNIVGLSDAQAADLIRRDQIDILVDLAMHTAHNRLLVFARKPAPVQVTYLAYCSSTGLPTIDYRLSDPYMDPPGGDGSIYSERTICLPDTYWCYQPGIAPSLISPLPALKQGFITFGSLNNFCKVSEPTLIAWAKLLCDVPKSQLLLHAREGGHRQRVLDRMRPEGIEPHRVRFAPIMPMKNYFELYHQIDVALDPFPYGGGTTTCDALWMGVPVVSLAGKTAVGRGGLSILSNIGLPELVADSEERYVRIASGLAHDPSRLGNLRSTLRQRMERSPLMDAPRFARNVETAYRQMWRSWCGT
jgi:predicted O-linked N-acetylglucosamine transferase (SPINDLY family)